MSTEALQESRTLLLNDFSDFNDKGFTSFVNPGGGVRYIANDSTANFILGMGSKRRLDKPPYITTQCLKDNINFIPRDEEEQRSNGPLCYSDVKTGYIQYYIDTDFVNPFNQIFPHNALTFKQISDDNTIEYTRQPYVPISYQQSPKETNQWFHDTQNQREDIQALKMRTIIRHNYTPSKLF